MHVKIIRRGRAAQAFRANTAAFERLLARAHRYPAPLVEDTSPAAPSDAPFQTRYLEYRLTELALYTGRHFYLRLTDKFTPETSGQTAAEYVASLPAKLHLPAGAVLAYYFTEDNQWFLAGAATGLSLPEIKPRPAPKTPPATPEAIKRRRQGDIYDAVTQVVSALVDQTDPK
jgi:hypothetical protein